MLRKLRADWRRGRASRYIRLGEPFNYTWNTETAGPIVVRVRFFEHQGILVMRIAQIASPEAMEMTEQPRADVGLREIRGVLEWVAGMAADLGYTRMRVEGPRTKRAAGFQRFEFDLDRFLRRPRGGR